MKFLALLATLSLVPGAALAAGCHGDKDEAALTCAEGLVWNPDLKTCDTSTS